MLEFRLRQFLMEFLIKTVCWSDPEMRAAVEPRQGGGYININWSLVHYPVTIYYAV